MLKSNKEINQFYKGVKYFNSGQFRKAHTEWEHLWKSIGQDERRDPLKGLMQLTGAHANCVAEKWDAVRYLWKKSRFRIQEHEAILSMWVDIKTLYSILNKIETKTISLKVFNELKIHKKWGRLHNDLGTK